MVITCRPTRSSRTTGLNNQNNKHNDERNVVIGCALSAGVEGNGRRPRIGGGEEREEHAAVFVMLGRSNVVGLAHLNSFEYRLQDPYLPSLDEASPGRPPGFYYAKAFAQTPPAEPTARPRGQRKIKFPIRAERIAASTLPTACAVAPAPGPKLKHLARHGGLDKV